MLGAKQLFGFNPKEVKRYITMLESNIELAKQEKEIQQHSAELKKAELIQQVEELMERVSHLGELEQELRVWIEKNN